MASFTQHKDWILYRNESTWENVFCVAEPETLTIYKSDDRQEELGQYIMSTAAKTMTLESPGVPAIAYQAMDGRPHGFMVMLDLKNQEGRTVLYFDGENEANQQAWMNAIAAAAATPKQLEAWIDDFSDIEDDGHARRSSIEHTEGIDWAKFNAPRKSKMAPIDDSMVGALSVKAANLADFEDDMEDVVCSKSTNKRSSLENWDDLDWATLGQPKGNDDSDAEESEEEEEDDDTGADEGSEEEEEGVADEAAAAAAPEEEDEEDEEVEEEDDDAGEGEGEGEEEGDEEDEEEEAADDAEAEATLEAKAASNISNNNNDSSNSNNNNKVLEVEEEALEDEDPVEATSTAGEKRELQDEEVYGECY